MARFLQKARRAAILRWARAEPAVVRASKPVFEPEEVVAIDGRILPRNIRVAPRVDVGDTTPAPVSVALSRSQHHEVAPVRLVPASRPRGKRRLVLGAVAAALVATLSVGGFVGLARSPLAADAEGAPAAQPWHPKLDVAALRELAPMAAQEIAKLAELAPEPLAPPPPAAAADAHLEREGYAHIPGGVVFVPSTFRSTDGAYDLYVHFHGNARVVLESAEYAGLNAIVAVVNLGVNSAPYLDAYDPPGSFERTVGSIGRALGERGLDNAHLRRLAIGSWSGGYGAISRILDREPAHVDAVMVLDGIHCGFLEENKKALNVLVISPFLTGAKRAAEGELLFSITHSEIDPITYAGSNQTAAYLLDAVHGTSGEPAAAPEHVELKAAEGAVAKKLEKFMEPTSEARVGSFHVRGYRGNTPEHHMAHLLQMGATVMPELVARWAR